MASHDVEAAKRAVAESKAAVAAATKALENGERYLAHLTNGGDVNCKRCRGYGARNDGFLGDDHPCEVCNTDKFEAWKKRKASEEAAYLVDPKRATYF